MKIVKYHRKHMPKVCNDGFRRQIVVETEFPRVVHHPKIPGRPQEKINLELSGNVQLEMSREEAAALIRSLTVLEWRNFEINPKTKKPKNMEPFIQAYKDLLQAEVGTTHQNFDDLSLEKIRHDCVSFLKLSKEYLNGQNLTKVAKVFQAHRNGVGFPAIEGVALTQIARIAERNFKPLLVRCKGFDPLSAKSINSYDALEVLEA